jgi:ABC-type thiamin/hydroxymethylpyrimidine transport system permease subunit
MKNKYLIILSIVPWLNIGLFYFLYLNEIETILIGVFRELTIIPSYLCGILFPIWLLVRIITKHFKPQAYLK